VSLSDANIKHDILKEIVSLIGETRFGMWFGAAPELVLTPSRVQICVENSFSAEWIRQHFSTQIQKAVSVVLGKKMDWEIIAEHAVHLPVGTNRLDTNGNQAQVNTDAENRQADVSKKRRISAKSKAGQQQGTTFRSLLPGAGLYERTVRKTQSPKVQPPRLPVVRKQLSPPVAECPPQKPLSPARTSNTVEQRTPPAENHVRNSNNAGTVRNTPSLQVQTLDNFVEGTSNQLAVRAAELAVRYPGKISPIYIYGSTSVGKTHLLEAVKNQFRRHPKIKPPLYLTAEQFTTAFIEGLRQGIPLFRNKFRDISVLLLDDIQFFAGKESTQTEFFRTIETLKKQGVQIVLTGNRSLADLGSVLKPEIITRLEAGMECEIHSPERETLLGIFRQMVTARNLPISDDVCRFVVSRLTTHARQLSGALNRLHAVLLTAGTPMTVTAAENALQDLIRNNIKSVKMQDIEKAVCETFQLGSHSLQSKSRTKKVSHPRMLAMWLARKYTRSALSEIGQYFGDRSHSTVVSAQKKVDQWLAENAEMDTSEFSDSVSEIIKKVENILQLG
jgi:chromosomal replication initiator protein